MDFDVIVAGAGPAGCLLARDLARAGHKVGIFDPGTHKKLGRPVIVEVESAVFDRVGVAYPQGGEVPYHARGLRVFGPSGTEAFFWPEGMPTVSVYLDRFAAKLLGEAVAAGAKFHPGHTAKAPLTDGTAVVGAAFTHGKKTKRVHARLTVDATGFAAALVRSLPPSFDAGFDNDPRHVVTAGTALHAVDEPIARAAVAQGRHGEGEVWASVGNFGAYSTVFGFLSIEAKRAYILIGRKANWQGPTLERLLEDYKNERGYFAKKIVVGTGHIRIRHALERPVFDGFLAVGESANMVIPLNGSGVGTGMTAAAAAAMVASAALKDGGPTTQALWPYASGYHRGRGALLALFDVMRQYADTFTTEQVEAITRMSGPAPLAAINAPGSSPLAVEGTIRRLQTLAGQPSLLPIVGRMAARAAAVFAHYRAYPATFDRAELDWWRVKKDALFAKVPRG